LIYAGDYDILCLQGATFNRTATWTIGGTAVNLTGWTAAMQVRDTYQSTTPIVTLTSGSGITLGGTAGTISWALSSTATAAIPEGQYVYDLELNSGSEITRILQGNFTVSPEVTR